MLELLVDWLVAPLPLELSARARLRAFRKGRPVFIGAHFGEAYHWADHLLCHGPRLWVVTNKEHVNEQRVELRADRDTVVIERHVGWSTSPRVAVEANGRRLAISTLSDFDLLVEAIESWRTAGD